jgi:hypothetical protein
MKSKDERDSILLDTFKKNLLALDKLCLTPQLLRIKQHLRTRIAEIEQTLCSSRCSSRPSTSREDSAFDSSASKLAT